MFRLYGKLPNKKDLLKKKLEVCSYQQSQSVQAWSPTTNTSSQERKYFDSGDYALTKAGKASESGITSISSQHPLPENIPHLTSPGPTATHNGNGNGNGSISQLLGGTSASPVKESSFLSRQTSIEGAEGTPGKGCEEGSFVPSHSKEGGGGGSVPTRWQ